jgi:hypothetical protein
MDLDKLNSLESMPVEHARGVAVSLLDPKTKPERLLRLKQDIGRARDSREVLRIMWNAYMSGTGYGVPTSAWQKRYRGG